MEVPPRFELGIRVLQTRALPLGYGTIFVKRTQNTLSILRPFIWSGLRGSNSLPQPWQGCALPDELNPHIKNM